MTEDTGNLSSCGAGMSEAEVNDLIRAAKAVRRFWQVTCDAHPERRDWEDNKVFYDLADAVDHLEPTR